MGRFLNGVFIGVGIALLLAPMRGEDMRTLLRSRNAQANKGGRRNDGT
jgi:gas vesicle protein